MKNVIFINASLTQGGSERAMSLIANGCVTAGMPVTMLLLRDKERTYALDPGIKCIQLRYKHKNKGLMLMERILAIRKIVQQRKEDTVVSFMTDINIFTIIACWGLKVRTIISERAHPLLGTNRKSKKPFIARALIKILYPKADKIVFQTEFAKMCYPLQVQKLGIIIPNPVSSDLPDVYKGIRRNVIVAAGRLTAQKNFKMLLEAFGKLNHDYPNYNLIVYGQGELLNNLKIQAQELQLDDKIEFPGFVDNVNQRIKDAAIFVSSSNFEGISNSILEALALGLPSVCTDCPVGGTAMIIQNDVNGILIPVGDTDALYRAMKRIIDDSNLAKSLSENAVKVREKYSLDNICKQWLDIL